MKKKYIIVMLILILIFSCGKKKKRNNDVKSKATIEQKENNRIKELTEKARKGDVEAQTQLGEAYLHGIDTKIDYKKAMEWSKKAAAKGSSRAMTNVGILYFEGFGVKKDYKQAYKLFSDGVDGGDMKALKYLGIMYEKGLGVEKSFDSAAFYYEMADSSGDLTVRYNLGKIYEMAGDYAKAVELYQKTDGRMDQVTAPMYEALGDLYVNGKGVRKNLKEASEWYEKASKSGSQQAKNKLDKLK